MSVDSTENVIQINTVDVNSMEKEIIENKAKICDSGVESGDTCVPKVPGFSEVEELPPTDTDNLLLMDIKNGIEIASEFNSSPTLSSPSSISPDVNIAVSNLLSFDEFPIATSKVVTCSVENKAQTEDHIISPEQNKHENILENTVKSANDCSDALQGNVISCNLEINTENEDFVISPKHDDHGSSANILENTVKSANDCSDALQGNVISCNFDINPENKGLVISPKPDDHGNPTNILENTGKSTNEYNETLQGKAISCNMENKDYMNLPEHYDHGTSTNILENTGKSMNDSNETLQGTVISCYMENNTEKNYYMNLPEHNDHRTSTNILEYNIESMNDFNYVLKDTDQNLIDNGSQEFSIESYDLGKPSKKNFTTSTASLNDHIINETETSTISKSTFSRSADNISIIEQNVTESLNSSTKELNTQKILTEFQNQKNKAAATHKMSPEPSRNIPEQNNSDNRYTRIPKELLPQDLGSLVKNVHGIFSSVSGSLKYAYNQTQRAPKPPVKTISRQVTNGKIMDDIFEDQVEKHFTQNHCTENLPVKNKDELSEVKDSQTVEGLCENTLKTEGEMNAKTDVRKLQIESLERLLAEQRRENTSLRERVKQHVDEIQEKDQTFKELETKLDLMSKRVEQAEREKDAAVMRYASVECAAIEAKRAAERAQAAERSALTEMELLNNKLRTAHSEKARICQLYDDKCHELSNSEKELAKVREDIKELEGRLKWTQSKLRMEIDAYKDSAERAERLEKQVAELEQAKETAAANATDSVRAKKLEQELKESQAALILCRHEKADLERRLSSCSHQLDSCKRERDSNSAALTTALADIEKLKESNLRLEEEAAELAALRAQAALADTLSAQLARETERASQAEEALSKERARAETCARREAAALEHAARLTAQHVLQRASTSDHEHKAQALALDNASLRERISFLESEVTRLQTALSDETERRTKETKALARKVAELTEEAAEANKRLEWEQGEISVLKKKHANAIKELNRELQRALKRCEQLEAKLPPTDDGSTRTGSISSLSSAESASHQQEERLHNGHSDLPDIHVREPDRQALIERIVSLQRAAARRSERCEFLEEHARQLTAELRAKSKLLRHLLCALPAGAVASSHSDAHKKEIARLGGGAMAAVWGGESGGMTLELSLEMNTKLQAVLEDALLKNITLKENLDTLGEEIARLKEQRSATADANTK